MTHYLGLDVGTSSVKAAVFDTDGALAGSGRAATPWRGMELDPDALVAATLDAAAQALDGRPVAGAGVASMAETGVLVDAHGRPVVPSIHWSDSRGGAEAERLAADLPDFPARSGLPVSSMCTLVKYAWMRAHWPASARGARWVNIGDWIVESLGGEPGAEPSLASRTGFYDLHEAAPRADALAWAGAPPGLALPPARGARGRATVEPLRGALLAVAGHDHVAAAIGAGAVDEGDVFDSCGTAEAIQRAIAPLEPGAVARAVAQDFTVGLHALPGRHVLQGSFRAGEQLQAVLDALGERADAPEHGAPYVLALEDVAARGAAILDRMAALAGPARRIVASGGWIEGAEARAAKARHFGPFEYVPDVYTGCRGAALTAAAACRGS